MTCLDSGIALSLLEMAEESESLIGLHIRMYSTSIRQPL